MAIDCIQLTTVFVRDQDRALDFYVSAVGLEKRLDDVAAGGARFIVVAPPGGPIGLAIWQAGPDDDTERRVGGFTGIVFGVDDVRSAHAELTRHGVTFVEPPTLQPWGALQAQFTDPDGNVLALHEN